MASFLRTKIVTLKRTKRQGEIKMGAHGVLGELLYYVKDFRRGKPLQWFFKMLNLFSEIKVADGLQYMIQHWWHINKTNKYVSPDVNLTKQKTHHWPVNRIFLNKWKYSTCDLFTVVGKCRFWCKAELSPLSLAVDPPRTMSPVPNRYTVAVSIEPTATVRLDRVRYADDRLGRMSV